MNCKKLIRFFPQIYDFSWNYNVIYLFRVRIPILNTCCLPHFVTHNVCNMRGQHYNSFLSELLFIWFLPFHFILLYSIELKTYVYVCMYEHEKHQQQHKFEKIETFSNFIILKIIYHSIQFNLKNQKSNPFRFDLSITHYMKLIIMYITLLINIFIDYDFPKFIQFFFVYFHIIINNFFFFFIFLML